MASGYPWTHALLLLLVGTIGAVLAFPNRYHRCPYSASMTDDLYSNHLLLHSRQGDDPATGESDALNCGPICEIESCGTPCGYNPPRSLLTRAIVDEFASFNDSSTEKLDTFGILQKRYFRIDGTSTTPQLPRSFKTGYTQAQAANYVFNQIDTGGTYDNQYGSLLGFFGKPRYCYDDHQADCCDFSKSPTCFQQACHR